jgi:hypothetical protein
VIDYIFWRAVMLTGVVLLAAVVYRLISGALPGNRKEAVR